MAKITNRYTISFDSIETRMSTEIQISKKEFDQQLRFLRSMLDTTAEDEYPMEERFHGSLGGNVIVSTYSFTVGTGTTYLTHYEAKPGYHFK